MINQIDSKHIHEGIKYIEPDDSNNLNLDPIINSILFTSVSNDVNLNIVDIYDKHPNIVLLDNYLLKIMVWILPINDIILTYDSSICHNRKLTSNSIELKKNSIYHFSLLSFTSGETWCSVFDGNYIFTNCNIKFELINIDSKVYKKYQVYDIITNNIYFEINS